MGFMKSGLQDLVLTNGSKIAVIGAGPAGAFFSLFAAQMASNMGLEVSVLLFDGKDFTRAGPKGCNLCAGVIAETLVERLKRRGVVLPEGKVQRKIEGYYLQVKAGSFLLRHPGGKKQITTVFRGNGPRFSVTEDNVSFDDYLLDHVRHRGIKLVAETVQRVEYPSDPGDLVKVICGSRDDESTFEVDLVVGAFGLNTDLMRKIQNLNFGYKPPRTFNARCIEIRLNSSFIQKQFGDNIFVYNWGAAQGMLFAGIIPKKDYITINVIGKRDVKRGDVLEFLDLLVARGKLPKERSRSMQVCQCAPSVPTTAAKRPYHHRLVIIGDASCSRYYKNGIESAFETAKYAAETAFNRGLSSFAFKSGYFSRVKRMIRDNFYGKILFKIYDLVYDRTFLSQVLLKVVLDEERRGKAKYMREVLWNMYTGNIPYGRILLKFSHPVLQWRLLITTFELGFVRVRSKLLERRK